MVTGLKGSNVLRKTTNFFKFMKHVSTELLSSSVETTSRGSFNHDQNNHVAIMIRTMHCLM